MISVVHVQLTKDFAILERGDEILCDWCLYLSCVLHGLVQHSQIEANADVIGIFGFGWTTSGEHQVMDSSSGTFSMMSLSTNSSILFFKGSIKWYGTLRGFCAIG